MRAAVQVLPCRPSSGIIGRESEPSLASSAAHLLAFIREPDPITHGTMGGSAQLCSLPSTELNCLPTQPAPPPTTHRWMRWLRSPPPPAW